jgi:hypothetical protein
MDLFYMPKNIKLIAEDSLTSFNSAMVTHNLGEINIVGSIPT